MVPYSDADTCMHCKKVQFTLVNRGYHCRKCGVVCCNPCSSKRFILPTQPSKPLRVCLTCYDKLTMPSTGGNKNTNEGEFVLVCSIRSGLRYIVIILISSLAFQN